VAMSIKVASIGGVSGGGKAAVGAFPHSPWSAIRAGGGGVRGVAPEAVPEGGAVPVPLPGVWASAGAERANRTSNIDVDEEQRMREF